MKIIVFGARGDVGSRVVTEALARGHKVTAVVRSEAQVDALPPLVTACVSDISNPDPSRPDRSGNTKLADVIAGHDLVISAVRPPDGQEDLLVALTRAVLGAAAEAGVRVLLVGGAASLMLPDHSGYTVLTAPDFLPEAVVPIARACQAQYEVCLTEAQADWSYLSPPAMLTPGARTGRYRLGSDVLLCDAQGKAAISMEDFAVALLDEAETPRHKRVRFTVAA
ncbi:NAD(P)-dependent oxidoreductase [Denitrobaculum tricleocarpae]|uniref:NADH-flavin reductase n=1 Tax=Denitrobaculum tricleocarpae TaxID=2591009 RepID=A0A545U2B7_9PROT|nr:NAD(P)H-binding protein [Denitrobaculum tricleocarpae]TQV83625.1 NADH-flavin reductase [Denitrobaculum tricleocarpae]